MIDHSGDIYEWDFKDRLVRTTTAESVADYVYDYSGQRVIKKSDSNGERKVVYYISNGFEIRDGKSIKYIFDGSRRVARLEGRLSEGGGQDFQLIEFQTGWNFLSLSVEPGNPDLAAVLAPLSGNYSEVWAFDSETKKFKGYVPAEGINDLGEIHARQGYIIKFNSPATILFAGAKVTSTDIDLQAGWNLTVSNSEVPISVADALTSVEGRYKAIWGYESRAKTWQNHFANEPDFLSSLETLRPGKAYWIETTEPVQLTWQLPTKEVYYYHLDHLGSSNTITNSTNAVVESTEFYPYGRFRNQESYGFETDYKYTGKEFDEETNLHYFGKRYYDPIISRWIKPDMWIINNPDRAFVSRNENNAYCGFAGNPIIYIDPSGGHVAIPVAVRQNVPGYDQPAPRQYDIYKYEVYDYDTYGEYLSAVESGRELTPTSTFELTFSVQRNRNPEILNPEERLAQVKVAWRNVGDVRPAKFSVYIADVEPTPEGQSRLALTEYGPTYVNRGYIAIHTGGPSASEGCATSPDPSWLFGRSRRVSGERQVKEGLVAFETYIRSLMGLPHNRRDYTNEDAAFIVIPGSSTSYDRYTLDLELIGGMWRDEELIIDDE
jgi:RHS repeat-associated protein